MNVQFYRFAGICGIILSLFSLFLTFMDGFRYILFLVLILQSLFYLFLKEEDANNFLKFSGFLFYSSFLLLCIGFLYLLSLGSSEYWGILWFPIFSVLFLIIATILFLIGLSFPKAPPSKEQERKFTKDSVKSLHQ